MDTRAHIYAAIQSSKENRPVLARALHDLLGHLDEPEPAHAMTPREAFASVAMDADTLREEIENVRRRAVLL